MAASPVSSQSCCLQNQQSPTLSKLIPILGALPFTCVLFYVSNASSLTEGGKSGEIGATVQMLTVHMQQGPSVVSLGVLWTARRKGFVGGS